MSNLFDEQLGFSKELLENLFDGANTSGNYIMSHNKNILSIENQLLVNQTQINNLIQSIQFTQNIQNYQLRHTLIRIQTKYQAYVNLIAEFTNKRREYFLKMMDIISNKQKLLKQLSRKGIEEFYNPIKGWAGKGIKSRENIAIMRSFLELSLNYTRYRDSRSILNHRLNALYKAVGELQGQVLASMRNFTNSSITLNYDRIKQHNETLFSKLTLHEDQLYTSEKDLFAKEKKYRDLLGLEDSYLGLMAPYIDRLNKTFIAVGGGKSELSGGNATKVLMHGNANIIPELRAVDTLSMGGLLQHKLNACVHYVNNQQNNTADTLENTMNQLLLSNESESKISQLIDLVVDGQMGISVEILKKGIDECNKVVDTNVSNHEKNPFWNSPAAGEAWDSSQPVTNNFRQQIGRYLNPDITDNDPKTGALRVRDAATIAWKNRMSQHHMNVDSPLYEFSISPNRNNEAESIGKIGKMKLKPQGNHDARDIFKERRPDLIISLKTPQFNPDWAVGKAAQFEVILSTINRLVFEIKQSSYKGLSHWVAQTSYRYSNYYNMSTANHGFLNSNYNSSALSTIAAQPNVLGNIAYDNSITFKGDNSSVKARYRIPPQLFGNADKQDKFFNTILSGGGYKGEASSIEHQISEQFSIVDPQNPKPIVDPQNPKPQQSQESDREEYPPPGTNTGASFPGQPNQFLASNRSGAQDGGAKYQENFLNSTNPRQPPVSNNVFSQTASIIGNYNYGDKYPGNQAFVNNPGSDLFRSNAFNQLPVVKNLDDMLIFKPIIKESTFRILFLVQLMNKIEGSRFNSSDYVLGHNSPHIYNYNLNDDYHHPIVLGNAYYQTNAGPLPAPTLPGNCEPPYKCDPHEDPQTSMAKGYYHNSVYFYNFGDAIKKNMGRAYVTSGALNAKDIRDMSATGGAVRSPKVSSSPVGARLENVIVDPSSVTEYAPSITSILPKARTNTNNLGRFNNMKELIAHIKSEMNSTAKILKGLEKYHKLIFENNKSKIKDILKDTTPMDLGPNGPNRWVGGVGENYNEAAYDKQEKIFKNELQMGRFRMTNLLLNIHYAMEIYIKSDSTNEKPLKGIVDFLKKDRSEIETELEKYFFWGQGTGVNNGGDQVPQGFANAHDTSYNGTRLWTQEAEQSGGRRRKAKKNLKKRK